MITNGIQYLFEESIKSFDSPQIYQPNLQSKYSSISSKIIQKQSTPIHIQIQLDNGSTEIIYPKVGDNSFVLANDFCLKHSLHPEMIQILAKGIKSTIQKIQKKTICNQKNKQNLKTQPNQKKANMQVVQKDFRSLRKNNYQNYQLDLYQRAIREKNSKNTWIEHQKINKYKQQMKECTYSPRINTLSKQIAAQKYNRHKRSTNQSSKSLTVQSSKSLTVRSKYQSINQKDEKQQIFQDKRQKSVFQYLYQDNRLRQLKKGQLLSKKQKQLQFKPKINVQSKKIIGNISFQERLQKYNSAKQKRLKKIADESIIPLQQKSQKQAGKINKTPKSISSKNINRSNQKRNLSKETLKLKDSCKGFRNNLQKSQKQNLTPFKKDNQNVKVIKAKYDKNKISNYKQFKGQSKNPSAIKNSVSIYNQRKRKIFEAIFNILDDDQDGIISITNINLMRIQPELMRILFPLLQELEIMDIQLTKTEFVKALDNLFKGLSPIDKNYLLCLSSNKITQMMPTFQPQLNEMSRRMVENTQRQQMTIYQFSMIKQKNIKKQLQKQRISKQKQVMKQCTFHPKINKKRIFY